MEGLEQQLGAILGNPQMMQQIMALAQSMEKSEDPPSSPQEPPQSLPAIDPALLAKLPALAGNATIKPEQKALLHALQPYLSQDRVSRLEKAMKAAHLAKFASSFLNQGGLSLLTGR